MKNALIIFAFLATLLSLPQIIEARSGCCSYHGGVCGNSCCDGSALSIKCAPYYDIPTYSTPIYKFPSSIEASTLYYPNNNGTYDVEVKLIDSSPSRYSASITNIAGSDPGPNVDFTSPTFRLNSIKSGRHYLNVKKEFNGYWSTVAYWTIDVPKWVPTPTPTITPTPYPTSVPTNTPIPLITLNEPHKDTKSSNQTSSLVGFKALGKYGGEFLFFILEVLRKRH